jgi:hypothetical protein
VRLSVRAADCAARPSAMASPAGNGSIMDATICYKCRRPAHRTISHYGPRCRRKILRAVGILKESRHPTAVKAAAIVWGGLLVPAAEKNVWYYKSPRSNVTYIVTPETCPCLDHMFGTMDHICKHQAAAIILAA